MMFEILKSELMYTGRAFKVQRVTARMPNGKERFFDLVDHAAFGHVDSGDRCRRDPDDPPVSNRHRADVVRAAGGGAG